MGYIESTDYAARNLIDLAMREEAELIKLKEELAAREAEYKTHKWDFETSDLSDDFSDRYVMGAFNRMAGAYQAANDLQVQVDALQASIGSKEASVQAICAALLQIAKQGISFVHGNPANAPNGRFLNGISLKEIIWEGRNQSMHYEEGVRNTKTISLFLALEAQFGKEFSLTLHPTQNRAKQIVKLLDWTNYSNYFADMKLLGL
jgi:hypothetical protein